MGGVEYDPVFLQATCLLDMLTELQNLSLQLHMVVRLHAHQYGILLSSFTICAGKITLLLLPVHCRHPKRVAATYCPVHLQRSSGALLH